MSEKVAGHFIHSNAREIKAGTEALHETISKAIKPASKKEIMEFVKFFNYLTYPRGFYSPVIR